MTTNDWHHDLPKLNLATLKAEGGTPAVNPNAKGGIYAVKPSRCPLCSSRFIHIEGRGLYCPRHPDVSPAWLRAKYPAGKRPLYKRTTDYATAYQWLITHRARAGDDFTPMRSGRTLATMAAIFLSKFKGYTNAKWHLNHVIPTLGTKDISDIVYANLEDLVDELATHETRTGTLSSKSIHDIMKTLHQLMRWLKRRQVIDRIPEFPKVSFRLKRRKTVVYNQQQSILAWLENRLRNRNPKLNLYIHILATYPSMRPSELLSLRNCDILPDLGAIRLTKTKTGDSKTIPILPDHMKALRFLKRDDSEKQFFAHTIAKDGAKVGQPFGKKLAYKWWKRACIALNIDEKVSIYPGTKHTTCRALRAAGRTPEEIKRSTLHSTDKSFNRYFDMSLEDLRAIYGTEKATGTTLAPKNHATA